MITLFKALKVFRQLGVRGLINKAYFKILLNLKSFKLNLQYQFWLKTHYPNPTQLKQQTRSINCFQFQPLISIITPVFNPNPKFFKACLNSVLNQSYPNWELCLINDASTNPIIKEIILAEAKKEQRIKYRFRRKNGHICRASNDGLKQATGAYVGFLDHDDFLWPNALYQVVELLNNRPHTQLIYTDEDKLELNGKKHVDPFFKPDWSPDYLRSINYLTHFTVIKKALVQTVGGFRVGYEGAQDWDLFLRVTNLLTKIGKAHPLNPKNPIQHLPMVLYSWRKSKTSTASEKHVRSIKPYAQLAQKKALTNTLNRYLTRATVSPTQYFGLWQIKYKLQKKPKISIIILNKNNSDYIRDCLRSIYRLTSYRNFEIILVDTNSTETKVFGIYKKHLNQTDNFYFYHWRKHFNFALINNWAVTKSRGEQLVFLNSDTKVITSDWLAQMLEYSQQPQVGAVGAKLVFPNNKIQHAGIMLGVGGIANHFCYYYPDSIPSSFPIIYAKDAVRNVSAVTGACLMIKKDLFNKIGGFNVSFQIAYNDVDLCLRLLQNKYFNVYTPFAKLLHYEGVSIGTIKDRKRDQKLLTKESQFMQQKWPKLLENDPFYNPNLSRNKLDLSLQI